MPPQPASHVFFFSYASQNLDSQLRVFFENLCEEVAPFTPWKATDNRVSYRDGKNIPLMEEWQPALMQGLQRSAALVCVTSLAYFQSRFCGQEFYVFDQRRRLGSQPGQQAPVVLPVIWAPTPLGLPPEMDQVQWKHGMPAEYETQGLRALKILEPAEYDRCVVAFALAIKDAWNKYPDIEELPNVTKFENIPNRFAGGTWEEAVDANGWVAGPAVANFVFAASSSVEAPKPPGRYGAKPSEWRPYLPPHQKTIEEMSKGVAKKQGMLYREIPIDQNLNVELDGAKQRKNLTVVVADPKTLPLARYRDVTTFDHDPWEGTAVLMPWDGVLGPWEANQQTIANMFPIRSQAKSPPFQAPIRTFDDFEPTLDLTLNDLRNAVTDVEAKKKPKSDEPPAQVLGPSGATTG